MNLTGNKDIVARNTGILSEFLAKTNFGDLPKEVTERAKLTIADTIGVMFNGSIEPEMQKFYERLPQVEEAVALRRGFPKTDISMASFANTTAACLVELDEGSNIGGHPALHVLPPVLALAQKFDKSGADLITAFVLGYEVYYRLLLCGKLRPEIYPHGNTGHVGAAAAVGKLLGWDAEKIRQIINCAAAFPLATSYAPTTADSTIASVFASLSAPIAFMCKDLVESGFTGYDGALEDTFGKILGDGDGFNSLALTDKLGIEYGIMNNYYKFHANCAVNHSALEAAANALDSILQHDEFPPYKPRIMLNTDDIKSIKVVTGNKTVSRAMFKSNSKLAAKFSLPYSLAVFLVTGEAGADSYSEELLQNAQVNYLQELVKLEIDPSMSEMARWAKIFIELNDGQIISGESKNIYGRPDNPANQLDLYHKFFALTANVLSEEFQNELWNSLTTLEKQKSVGNIFQ